MYFATHGRDVITAAAELSNTSKHSEARDLLAEYGYADLAREQNSIAHRNAQTAKKREDAISMIQRELPENEAARTANAEDLAKAQHRLSQRYGANPSGSAYAEERDRVLAAARAKHDARMAAVRALAEKKYEEQQAAADAPPKPTGPVADALRAAGALPAEAT